MTFSISLVAMDSTAFTPGTEMLDMMLDMRSKKKPISEEAAIEQFQAYLIETMFIDQFFSDPVITQLIEDKDEDSMILSTGIEMYGSVFSKKISQDLSKKDFLFMKKKYLKKHRRGVAENASRGSTYGQQQRYTRYP